MQIVSGTPGRVFDMIRRRNLRTRNLKMLVIDEAGASFLCLSVCLSVCLCVCVSVGACVCVSACLRVVFVCGGGCAMLMVQ